MCAPTMLKVRPPITGEKNMTVKARMAATDAACSLVAEVVCLSRAIKSKGLLPF
jgi:hypothetical protein